MDDEGVRRLPKEDREIVKMPNELLALFCPIGDVEQKPILKPVFQEGGHMIKWHRIKKTLASWVFRHMQARGIVETVVANCE